MIKKIPVFVIIFSLLFAFGCGRNQTDVLPVETKNADTQPGTTGAVAQDDTFFCGNWYATAPDGNGNTMALILDLGEDGRAIYKYGVPESELLEYYEGTWSVENGLLCLDLAGGPVADMDSDSGETQPLDFEASFEWEMAGESFVLTHAEGDEFLKGSATKIFIFSLMG